MSKQGSDKAEYEIKAPTASWEEDEGFRNGPCERWRKALLCIDLQYLGCSEECGTFDQHLYSSIPTEAVQEYLQTVRTEVIPNVQTLQNHFRQRAYEVIHCRIQCMTQDGRDRSPEHKKLGLYAPPGSRAAAFLPEVAPIDDEIIINKTASGVFIATNIEYILRNLCVSDLVVCGVTTNECISSAVRSACDLGFRVTVVSDATAGITRELHDASLLIMQDRYAAVMNTRETLEMLEPEIR